MEELDQAGCWRWRRRPVEWVGPGPFVGPTTKVSSYQTIKLLPVEWVDQQLGGRQEKVDGGQADHLFGRHGFARL